MSREKEDTVYIHDRGELSLKVLDYKTNYLILVDLQVEGVLALTNIGELRLPISARAPL